MGKGFRIVMVSLASQGINANRNDGSEKVFLARQGINKVIII